MLLDVTVPLVPGRTPVYPGDPELTVRRVLSRAAGDVADVSLLSCSTHCGTHVDAPAHLLDGGGVDALPLDVLVGPCVVVDVREDVDAAGVDALGLPAGTSRVLLRSRGAGPWDAPGPALTADGARALLARGVRLVGVDRLSVDADDAGALPVHEVLLAAGAVVVEALELGAVAPGAYELLCLPLLLPGCDGAPARVLLRTGGS
ncbi:cyclase family protein [Kineococcus sp. SYSU DK004]|uniref:cyclase family protein n=1 Tax=Kineococcus sp. SYSU DK004 TaxID=3383125 RepID=UPI003D7E65F5